MFKYKKFKRAVVFIGVLILFACREQRVKMPDVQEIVDQSIAVCGGNLFETNKVQFNFRDRTYVSEVVDQKEILSRINQTDSGVVRDVRAHNSFKRFVNDSLVVLTDSLARVYSNSVNSVHYFSKLPYGLNDSAVKKKLLGEVTLNQKQYYKIRVTFNKAGGGDDFEDTYIYWINKKTFKPDFLGYTFLTDGGGTRFRIAYNERYVNGIRFVDYKNYKTIDSTNSIFNADSLYLNDRLKLLSTIEIDEISVSEGNYN